MFNECINLLAVVFYKNPPELEDNAFSLCENAVIYSDNNVYLQEYASRNGKQSESIRNLPTYDENTKLIEYGHGEFVFSAGYTYTGFFIVVIDLALVIFTSVYILVIEPKRKRRKRAKSAANKAKMELNDEPVTYVKAPSRRKIKNSKETTVHRTVSEQKLHNKPSEKIHEQRTKKLNSKDTDIRNGNTKTFERPEKH